MQTNRATTLGLSVRLQTGFEEALNRVTTALKAEGFGVLTEIDVRDTMKQKLDVEFSPYTILGACNPPLAHRALLADPEAGLLLPCNVTVSQSGEGEVLVSFINPLAMLGVIQNETLQEVAVEAREKLERAAASLQAA